MLVDLSEEIHKFQLKGDNIIIGMDANENVKGRRMKHFMNSLNLKNAVLDLHGDECPGTTDTNDSNTPVDILMCSIAITPLRAGYDPDKGCASDHSWIWADFDKNDLFGQDFKDFHQFVYKLNTDDPRLLRSYNNKVWKAVKQERIKSFLDNLMKIPQGQFTNRDINQFDDLVKIITQIRQDVTDSLRHVYRGHIEWSP